jgi:hypothetical protein
MMSHIGCLGWNLFFLTSLKVDVAALSSFY